ncbi:hypothetical protein EGK75_12810 [Neisseria weixii]|uniref:Uncharacterized protein n=1 Tax=Neisseria weixii TaxID=1853276 RepID=A0A3N4MI77_9NEIS|nr:hypothetical protein EGK74_12750 [Neisseria weixii]RPD83730.1 hypothetical protein EGK75_12810 [Neisseria weixii]
MLTLLSKLLFLKLPLNERIFKFWFDFFEWAFRLLVAAESSFIYYAIFGKASFIENVPTIHVMLFLIYIFYAAIHFMDDCVDFLQGKD